MREILFRGKRIDNGEWVEGSLVNNIWNNSELTGTPGAPCCEIITTANHYDCWDDIIENGNIVEVDPSTVGQFTGIIDNNGKRIWEGDIFELVNVDGELVRGMVKYGIHQRIMDSGWLCDIPSFSFVVGDRNTFPIVKNYKGVHDLTIIEVLGNVFDNPELLNNSNTTQL